MTWLRWLAAEKAIRAVRRDPLVPGMVTLAWRTGQPQATVVEGPMGDVLYSDPTPETDHRVTLAGGPGTSMDVCIRAGRHERQVELSF